MCLTEETKMKSRAKKAGPTYKGADRKQRKINKKKTNSC